MKCLRVLIVLLLAIAKATAGSYDPNTPKVALLTIPKSGTHLLNKAIELITTHKVIPTNQFNPHSIFNSGNYYVQHITDNFDFIKDDPTIRKVLLIRDPRDTLISQIYWMQKKGKWLWCTPNVVAKSVNILPTFEEKLKEVILFPDEYYSIAWFTRKAMIWMQDPTILTLRYEELVGPEGGGDRDVQIKSVFKLAEFIGSPVTEEKAAEIADQLYGGTSTFRKGKKDGWPDYFSENNKSLLKSVLGQEIIELGYAEDNNW
ncbi:MAG TPA: sulfotransferase domain-containing protein [Chlamydiales bacterium]|nr:sulfotransferase domain-containing protein [Chlamydiales bacterium]